MASKAKSNSARDTAPTEDETKVYTKVYFYPPPKLLRDLDRSVQKEQKASLASREGPRRAPLSRSAYVRSVLSQFLETKREFDKHSDGGWAGYWDVVREAVAKKTKKKGQRT